MDETVKPQAQSLPTTEEEWRRKLTSDQYAVLRRQATEPPGYSPLNEEYRPGLYRCAGCGAELFISDTKFDSHCGWPSFYAALQDATETTVDHSHGMVRTEVHCAKCGGHLGHVFDDGPQPTGDRYCINGISLDFEAKEG